MTTTFLILGLIFPRLTLLWCYLGGTLPANDTPFALDFIAAFLAPRLLILAWILATQPPGYMVWAAIYGVGWLLSGRFGQNTVKNYVALQEEEKKSYRRPGR